MRRTDGIDMDADGLMVNAVRSAAYRQKYDEPNNTRWGGLFVDGDHDCEEDDNGDLPPRRRSISLNQLLYSEPLQRDFMARTNTEKLSPSVNNHHDDDDNNDGLTAIQRLIDAQYDSCATGVNNHRSGNSERNNNNQKKNNSIDGDDIYSEVLEGKSDWDSALPPRPVCYSKETILKETHMRLGDREDAEASRLPDKRETCSVGVQCEMRAAKKAATLRHLEQLRQQSLSGDPESIARLLARHIRELEMERFGHSSAFTSALLQQL
ncbi:hypothetical protein TcG_05643 [Trypanosoma cruzi]|nr:hypothetical protein TcG_05643 [Trypanosoma cruzi]